jgi:hypothetical protein
MAWAAAPKKCPRLFQLGLSSPSRRKYASWMRAVGWSVAPGRCMAIRAWATRCSSP